MSQPSSATLESRTPDYRRAAGEFLATVRAVAPAAWDAPRAPGKWSPAQVTEHVTLALEVSRGIIHGVFHGRQPFPRLLRPVVRTLFLSRVLRRGDFGPGGKAPEAFQPTASPGRQDVLAGRFEAAASAFEADLAAAGRAGGTSVDHPFFGRLALSDHLLLQTIHMRHHRRQLPTATA